MESVSLDEFALRESIADLARAARSPARRRMCRFLKKGLSKKQAQAAPALQTDPDREAVAAFKR